jgi:hypothetical protein
VSVNLTAGLYYYEWFNPVSGTVASTGSAATQGGVELFTVPFAGDAVLFLYNANTLSEVWIDLGTIDMQNRLDHLQPSDGETVPDSINIRSCRRNLDLEGPDPDSRFYFSVDDEFAFEGSEPEVHITIEYFDLGTGVLTLRYDSSYQAPFPNDVYKNGGSVVLADSGAWKTHTFHVTDAYFGNRQSEGADLLIARDPNGIFYLDVVKISTKPGPAVLTQPLPVTVHQNQSYQLTVAATPSGAASLSYRWQRNGQDLDDDLRISGANTATLNVSQARMEDAGNYRCAVVEDVMRTYTNEVSVELAPLGERCRPRP